MNGTTNSMLVSAVGPALLEGRALAAREIPTSRLSVNSTPTHSNSDTFRKKFVVVKAS